MPGNTNWASRLALLCLAVQCETIMLCVEVVRHIPHGIPLHQRTGVCMFGPQSVGTAAAVID